MRAKVRASPDYAHLDEEAALADALDATLHDLEAHHGKAAAQRYLFASLAIRLHRRRRTREGQGLARHGVRDERPSLPAGGAGHLGRGGRATCRRTEEGGVERDLPPDHACPQGRQRASSQGHQGAGPWLMRPRSTTRSGAPGRCARRGRAWRTCTSGDGAGAAADGEYQPKDYRLLPAAALVARGLYGPRGLHARCHPRGWQWRQGQGVPSTYSARTGDWDSPVDVEIRVASLGSGPAAGRRGPRRTR